LRTPLDRLATSRPLQVFALALAGLSLLSTAVWVAGTHHLLDRFHQPFGGDFIIFYATSRLILAGHGLAAFDPARLLAAERAVIPGVMRGLMWCYPPPFQLLVAPLALLPFRGAYLVFELLTATPYLLLLRRLAGGARLWGLAALASTGLFVNAWQGQNAFLTAACLGWGLLVVERRPVLGGVLLGCLVYKPQFGLVAPLVLMATGRWRAVAAAAASGLLLIGVSTLAFGAEAWRLFFRTLPHVSENAASGVLPWSKMPSVTIGLLSLGLPRWAAGLGQIAVALAVAALTARCWRGPARHELKVAVAVLASLLLTPYAFNYDLALLAVPGFVALRTPEGATPVAVNATVLAAALLPTLTVALARLCHAQPAALLIAAMFAAQLRVAGAEAGAARLVPAWARFRAAAAPVR
jgi:hypothetical protein